MCWKQAGYNLKIGLVTWLLLSGGAWVTVALWLIGAFLTWRVISRQPRLDATTNAELTDSTSAPLVSILVPARDEERRVLALSVRSMLRQDYGDFEVIAVDDRSTDRTGAILREIARTDEKLRVIDGAELPAGWLGKPHALQQAFIQSRGAWVLATDADMIFEPAALLTAIDLALKHEYDAVTLLPHVRCESFWERVFMPVFGWFMLVSRPVERVNDAGRKDAIGVGGFFLIKREWLERFGGWHSLRADVAEDLRMAENLKAAGASLRLEYAPVLLSTRMQTNLREIWEGFTKNLFAGARFRLPHAIFGSLAVIIFAVLPVLVWLFCLFMMATSGVRTAYSQIFVPTFVVWLIQVVTFARINRASGVPVIYALAVPLGHLLFVLILLNSSLRIASGGGVMWKGRKLYERTGVQPPRA